MAKPGQQHVSRPSSAQWPRPCTRCPGMAWHGICRVRVCVCKVGRVEDVLLTYTRQATVVYSKPVFPRRPLFAPLQQLPGPDQPQATRAAPPRRQGPQGRRCGGHQPDAEHLLRVGRQGGCGASPPDKGPEGRSVRRLPSRSGVTPGSQPCWDRRMMGASTCWTCVHVRLGRACSHVLVVHCAATRVPAGSPVDSPHLLPLTHIDPSRLTCTAAPRAAQHSSGAHCRTSGGCTLCGRPGPPWPEPWTSQPRTTLTRRNTLWMGVSWWVPEQDAARDVAARPGAGCKERLSRLGSA